ncbi:MAG: AgmX/PglI C-terminal domain-containing protein [Calditrichaceae bacterium]
MDKSDQFDYFELRWHDRIDRRFSAILSLCLLMTLTGLYIAANMDYDQFRTEVHSQIVTKYKQFAAELILEPQKITDVVVEPGSLSFSETKTARGIPERLTPREIRDRERKRIEDEIGKSEFMASIGKADPYADLPDPELDFLPDDRSNFIELERPLPENRIRPSGRSDHDNYDAGTLDDPLKSPFNYKLTRRGAAYIEFTDELLRQPDEHAGYRDPDEISRVIYDYRPMIEYCFRKGSRQNTGMKGYIKVQFRISYEGHVLPESIKIISSTIHDRSVEQCIKNYISRWRNFKRLDESMGIAKVVQKFVFN